MTHLCIQNASVHPSVFRLFHHLWICCLEDGKKPPSDLVREYIDNCRHRPPHYAGLHIEHVCSFPLGSCLTMLNGSKCRTRGFPSGRSDWCGLFIPGSDGGTSSSDAPQGHGDRNGRLHVPSVSGHFFSIQFDNNV